MDFLFRFLVMYDLVAEGLDLVKEEKVVVKMEVKLAVVLCGLTDEFVKAVEENVIEFHFEGLDFESFDCHCLEEGFEVEFLVNLSQVNLTV